MQRRQALQILAAAAAAMSPAGKLAAALAKPERSTLDRLGMTTVCLRDRIPTHPNQAIPLVKPALALVDAPKFIRDTFGLTNIETWNFQFPSDSDDYCRTLRARTEQAGCRISNIQLDGDYDLSSIDPDKRRQSIEFVKAWMARTALLGAPTMRANIDNGSPTRPFDAAALVPIVRELGDYGKTVGVRLLIENHIGHSRSIANVAALLALVKHDNVGGLLDWGNSDAATIDQRLADFSLMFPYLSLVSAKGLHFDSAGQHVEYPIRPIVLATERSGYSGLYSIELYTEDNFPDPIIAVKSMIKTITESIKENTK